MLVPQMAAATIITSDEIEADVAARVKAVEDAGPIDAAIKDAQEGKYLLFDPPWDVFHQSKVSGAWCGSIAMPQFVCSEICTLSKQRGPYETTDVLKTYNYALLAMPESPFAWRCKAADEAQYDQIKSEVIQKLGLTPQDYDARRAKHIASYRILDIAAEGDLAALKDYDGALNVQDARGYGALEYAQANKKTDMVKALLATGKVSSTRDDFFDSLVLLTIEKRYEYAAFNKCPIVEDLTLAYAYIDSGADLVGQKALYFAAQAGHLDMVQKILQKPQAHHLAEGLEGALVADLACAPVQRRLEIMREILRAAKGKPLTTVMHTCWPWMYAVTKEELKLIKLLRDAGVTVESKVFSDKTFKRPVDCLYSDDEIMREHALKLFKAVYPNKPEYDANEILLWLPKIR